MTLIVVPADVVPRRESTGAEEPAGAFGECQVYHVGGVAAGQRVELVLQLRRAPG